VDAGDVKPLPGQCARAVQLLEDRVLEWSDAFEALTWPHDADPDSLNRAQLGAVINYLEALEEVQQ